ncbi:MAG: hypothetical protein WA902_24500 [Thermosynechococcaceae cyanobacterium]
MKNPKMLKTALCGIMTLSCLAVIVPNSLADTCVKPQGSKQFGNISEDCKPKVLPEQDGNATEITPQDSVQTGSTGSETTTEPVGGAQLEEPEPSAKQPSAKQTFPTLERRGPRNSFHIVN